MDDNNKTKQKPDESVEIAWLNRFEEIKYSSDGSELDIDFITRLHELEGR
jgi:hypothetical protein